MMLNRKETEKRMKERMRTLDSAEMCALFLLSVNRQVMAENARKVEDEETAIRLTGSVLARFFRQTDMIGYLGSDRYIVFFTGNITGDVVYEKAAGLAQTLRFAWGDDESEIPGIYVGVYLSTDSEKSYTCLLRKAEYALEMAKKNENHHFYVYASSDTQEELKRGLAAPAASQMMFHYIDEGVRVIEVGRTLKTVYVSPGFYRRLSLDEESAKGTEIQIHPDDRQSYEELVRETARNGKPGNCSYRVSLDGQSWTSCRVRLLQVRMENEERDPIVIEISHNTAGLERLKSQLDEKKAWLSFVADQTDYQLWEVDVRSKVFRLLYTGNILSGRQDSYQDFPESLIESGRIHSGSAEAFRAFGRELLEGRMQNSGNFMVQYRQTSCYGWSAISYRMFCDENGRPIKAIGIKEDLSYIPCQQTRFIQRRIMPADLYSNLYCFLQANLTTDAVEKLILEGRERIRLIQYQTYDEIIEKGISRLFSSEDVKRFRKEFERECLLEEFEKGRCWFYEKCRVIDTDGSIRRISVGVNLARDPETREVCLYAYLSRLDHRTQWERCLKEKAQTDPETGVYTEETLEKLIRGLMEQGGRNVCTLVQVCIAGADELFFEDGRGRKEQDIVTALHVFLSTDCLVGRGDTHNLLIFFPGGESKAQIRSYMENAFSFARISLSGMREMKFLRFVAGAIQGSMKDCVLEDMLLAVSRLCALHAGEAADMVDFCQEKEAGLWGKGTLEDPVEWMRQYSLELSHMMTEEDKDMALECMELMLESDHVGNAINGVLGKIGLYYKADRVYILMLTEDKQIMTMLNEWVASGKCSIQQSISGKRTSSFPVIDNYAKNPKPMLLARPGNGEKSSWQYAIYPMDNVGDSEQMLCMENPQRYVERTALLDKILPLLSRARSRIHSEGVRSSLLDRFYALPNMDDCMDMLYSIASDEYSSLGVLMVDVPDYEHLKTVNGFEYGRQLLLRISEVLLKVFGRSLLFHTKETEFLVLCTDVVYHSFLNACARAKQMLNGQYAGQIRMGCTWSDGVFAARDLVEKARSLMKCDTPMPQPDTEFRLREEKLFLEQEAMAKLQASGQFTIYLQPKIDIRSGVLMGAEALVRILDRDGKLLSHGRVIEVMEKEGTIQKLDYFVFDRMLDALNQWRKKGYAMFPVSSNFSRNTLLNPSTLASVLAIMSHYPRVPQELVELEITETAGDFENNTFAELIRRFGEYGLQFSLDDFGSGYSNVNMLAKLKFHSIKLDRSLIKNMIDNEMSRMIVRDLVQICEKCGILCVAEGVETRTQAEMLLEDGCICAQGFYYDRPMSLEEFEKKYLRPQKKEDEG